MFVRVIRYRWLPGHADDALRLARLLVESAQGQADCSAIRVLNALDHSREALVVFEWATRAALEAHIAAAGLERLAPWAVPLLHWRTDQAYERIPPETLAQREAAAAPEAAEGP